MYAIELVSIGQDFYADLEKAASSLNSVQTQFKFNLPSARLRGILLPKQFESYTTDQAFAWLAEYRERAGGSLPFLIGFLDGMLSGEELGDIFGSHRAVEGPGLAVVTVKDQSRYAKSRLSYLCYWLTRYALTFVAPKVKTHKDPAKGGCFFDKKLRKEDLRTSLESGRLCDPCMAQLEKLLTPEIYESLRAMIATIKRYEQEPQAQIATPSPATSEGHGPSPSTSVGDLLAGASAPVAPRDSSGGQQEKQTPPSPSPSRFVSITALVFSGLLILFLMGAYFVGGAITESQRDILTFLTALCGGYAAGFIGGSMALQFDVPQSGGGKLALSATGGIAVMIFLYVYPPYSHAGAQKKAPDPIVTNDGHRDAGPPSIDTSGGVLGRDTGDVVIDRVLQKLAALRLGKNRPSDAALIEAMRPLFARPAFYGIREENWRLFLYPLCRTRLLLEECSSDFVDAGLRAAVAKAIHEMVALENSLAPLYGKAFSVSGHIAAYINDQKAFVEHLPPLAFEPTSKFLDERDKAIRKIRTLLKPYNLTPP